MTDPLDHDPHDATHEQGGVHDGVDESEQLRLDEGLWWSRRLQAQLEGVVAAGTPTVAREPCPECQTRDAILINISGQNTVRCKKCHRHLYNAPKTETGEVRRTVETVRKGIKPSQQARIFDRDQGRCIFCGRNENVGLTLGHLLSIEEGLSLGAMERELASDANLAVMCEACNLGLGRTSVYPRTYAVLMWRLVQAQMVHESIKIPPTPPDRARPAMPADDSAPPSESEGANET
jgi:5-methylcytosine-specific restriction endonuclease McrA